MYLPDNHAILLRYCLQVSWWLERVWHLLLAHSVQKGGAELTSPTTPARLDAALLALQTCPRISLYMN